MLLSIGIVLPFLTLQIKEIGDSLLPMHIPVMMCGLLCGPYYGLLIGVILPLLRSMLFSMPPLYPNAVWMAAELATYGFTIGFIHNRFTSYSLKSIYISLVTSMISGRVIWGITKAVLLGLGGKAFTAEAFIVGGFVDALPGIVLQLILIPSVMSGINHIRFSRQNKQEVKK